MWTYLLLKLSSIFPLTCLFSYWWFLFKILINIAAKFFTSWKTICLWKNVCPIVLPHPPLFCIFILCPVKWLSHYVSLFFLKKVAFLVFLLWWTDRIKLVVVYFQALLEHLPHTCINFQQSCLWPRDYFLFLLIFHISTSTWFKAKIHLLNNF